MEKIIVQFIFALSLISMTLPSSVRAETKGKATAKTQTQRSEPPIAKGASISILSYDPESRDVIVRIEKEPGVGPNITRPEFLVEAIQMADAGDRADMIKDPGKFLGTVFVLQKPLKLLVPDPTKRY